MDTNTDIMPEMNGRQRKRLCCSFAMTAFSDVILMSSFQSTLLLRYSCNSHIFVHNNSRIISHNLASSRKTGSILMLFLNDYKNQDMLTLHKTITVKTITIYAFSVSQS